MYAILLLVHSYIRWLVLLSLLFALYRNYRGWIKNAVFTSFDNNLRWITAMFCHVQLVIGLSLYFISPLVSYFFNHYREAVKQREIRFFGMEHSSMMIIAIVIITIGSARAKRTKGDKQKFKTIALWFTAGLLLILSSIPWQFSPLVHRPLFRTF